MGTKRKMVDSGVEWIGEVPSEWRVEKLSGLVQETSNKNRDMKENNLLSLSYGRIVRKDIESNQGLLPQSFEGYNIVSPGDVVLRLTDLQNDQRSLRTALVTERGIITSAYTTISAPAMEAKYFAYAMNACDSSKVFYRLGGGVRQSMRFQDIKQILIPIPDSFEQQSIATFLDHHVGLIDRERELIDQKIGLLKDKRKALIFECVTGKRTIVEAQHLAGVDDWSDIVGSGSLVAVPTPGKDDPFVKGGRLVDSGVEWLGKIPNSWEIARNKDILKLTKTQVKNGGSAHDLLSLGKKGIVFRDKNSSHGKFPANFDTYQLVNPGDFVFCLFDVAETPRTIGRAKIPGMVTGAYDVFSPTPEADPAFLEYFYTGMDDRKAYSPLYSGMRNTISKGVFGGAAICLPPLPEQQAIATFLDHETNLIDREIELLETKSSLLADKRKALIFEAVTGKIDCTQP